MQPRRADYVERTAPGCAAFLASMLSGVASWRGLPFGFGVIVSLARALPVLALFATGERLSAPDFGILGVIVTAQTVTTALMDAGTDGAATFVGSRDSVLRRDLVSALSRTKAVLALMGTGLFLVPALLLLRLALPAFLLLTAVFVVGNLAAAATATRRIAHRLTGAPAYAEARSLLREKTLTAVVFLGAGLTLPASAGALAFGFGLAVVLGPAVGRLPAIERGEGRPAYRTLLLNALPFAAGILAALLVWRFTVALLAAQGELAEAGFFTAAYYPVQALAAVPAASAPLLLLRALRGGPTDRMILTWATLLGCACAATLIGVLLLARPVLPTPLQADSGFDAALICLLSLPAIWFNTSAASLLRRRMGVWAVAPAQGAAMVIGVTAALLLVPGRGAVGGAFALVLAECTAAVIILAIAVRGVCGAR